MDTVDGSDYIREYYPDYGKSGVSALKKTEKNPKNEKFWNIIFGRGTTHVVTLCKLIEHGLSGVSYIRSSPLEIRLFAQDHKQRTINFILNMEKEGFVVCEKEVEEGRGFRYTYKLVEEYREALKDLLEKLGL